MMVSEMKGMVGGFFTIEAEDLALDDHYCNNLTWPWRDCKAKKNLGHHGKNFLLISGRADQ